MSNVLQIDRNGIDEAVNDLQELINEINEVNISKKKVSRKVMKAWPTLPYKREKR